MIPPVGTRVRLKQEYVVAHEFHVDAGATGVIAAEPNDAFADFGEILKIKMDDKIEDCAEEYDNSIIITASPEDRATEFAMFFEII